MAHANRNWRRYWSVAADGTSAVHQTGLVATCINGAINVDETSRDKVYWVLVADPEVGSRAGATLARLIQEAHMIFEVIG